MLKVNKTNIDNLLPLKRKAGGIRTVWTYFHNIGTTVESTVPRVVGKEMVNDKYYELKFPEVTNFKSHKLVDPTKYGDDLEGLFNAVKNWYITTYKKKETTIKRRISYARKMSSHPVYPVNWFTLDPVPIINYLDYRWDIDYGRNRGQSQILNEWKTVNTFAKAYGLNIDNWGYYPPEIPKPQVKIIPPPHQVHTLIHTKYSKDLYENALVQYVLTHGFVIGWRPSTIVNQKVSSVFYDDGYLVVNEVKKNRERQIFPDMDILVNTRRKSFKNWIERWRPQVENEYSDDFLYLQPNGRPFTVAYLRKYLAKRVKPVYGGFYPYLMRHWCAIARLIRCKIDYGVWDKAEVQDWLGHDKVSTTEDYVRFAKKYYKLYGLDWIKAILKFHKHGYTVKQENGLNSKESKNTFVSNGNNRNRKECSRRDSNPSRSLERAS